MTMRKNPVGVALPPGVRFRKPKTRDAAAFTVRVSKSLRQRLERWAWKHSKTMSDVVCLAVGAFLSDDPERAKELAKHPLLDVSAEELELLVSCRECLRRGNPETSRILRMILSDWQEVDTKK